jgi:hypothetical protein
MADAEPALQRWQTPPLFFSLALAQPYAGPATIFRNKLDAGSFQSDPNSLNGFGRHSAPSLFEIYDGGQPHPCYFGEARLT